MYKMVFDTETTALDKPFCYDVGYAVINDDSGEVVEEKHFVIEQVWHNLPLFESAYYKEKRQKYVSLMRGKKAFLVKWGQAMKAMAQDIKKYGITDAYAYNSTFDDKVFSFNCDWYKCNNPLDTVAIHDIWGYASEVITGTEEYKIFCEEQKQFTDTGNYKGSAEAVYRFITKEYDFEEEHMGLYDAEIEATILLYCVSNGANWDTDYEVKKILPRLVKKPFTVKINGQVMITGEYVKKYCRNDVYNFTVTD